MEAFDFPVGVVAESICHLFVPHCNGDRQVDVGGLHGCFLLVWVNGWQFHLPYPLDILAQNPGKRHDLL
jgi:hypothetical protein